MEYNNPNDQWLRHDPYKDMNTRQRFVTGCANVIVSIVVILTVLVLCLTLGGCTTTKYVPVMEYRTDTVWQSKTIKDSVYLRDSIIIRQAGDTVFCDRWHTRWRERLQRDTVYQSRTDSIPVPYEVEKIIRADLSWWQRTQMYAGDVLLILITALCGYGIFRFLKFFKIVRL